MIRAFFLAVLVVFPTAAGAVSRKACREACADAIEASCTDAAHPGRCRKAIIHECRQEGIDFCAPTTTLETTTTTTTLDTTTSTEEPSTTTTTAMESTTTSTTIFPHDVAFTGSFRRGAVCICADQGKACLDLSDQGCTPEVLEELCGPQTIEGTWIDHWAADGSRTIELGETPVWRAGVCSAETWDKCGYNDNDEWTCRPFTAWGCTNGFYVVGGAVKYTLFPTDSCYDSYTIETLVPVP